jgi:hypothetical protein
MDKLRHIEIDSTVRIKTFNYVIPAINFHVDMRFFFSAFHINRENPDQYEKLKLINEKVLQLQSTV